MAAGMEECYDGGVYFRLINCAVLLVRPWLAVAALVPLAKGIHGFFLPLEFDERIVLGAKVQDGSRRVGSGRGI